MKVRFEVNQHIQNSTDYGDHIANAWFDAVVKEVNGKCSAIYCVK